MWHSESAPPTGCNARIASSTATLNKKKSQSTSRLSRAISFQFLYRDKDDFLDHETKCFIKLRYKDTAKYVIWPSCMFDGPIHKSLPPKAAPLEPKEPKDPRAVLFKAEMEDEKTPYLAATINSVLRSDSEDSSDTEDVINITRL